MSDVNIWVDTPAPVRARAAHAGAIEIRFNHPDDPHSIGLHLPRDVAERLHTALGEHLEVA